MADLSLITILPSQPVQGVGQVQVSQGSTSQAAPIATSLPAGTVLQGFIVNRDPSGNPILRTESGDVAFSSNFFLKIGSEVTIRIENSAGNSLAHILSVDGQSPAVAETISAFANEPEVILGQHFSPPTPLSPALNAATPINTQASQLAEPTINVTGTVISQPQSTSSNTIPVPVGTQVTLKIVNIDIAGNNPIITTNPASTAPATPSTQPPNTALYATYARAVATTTTATPSAVTSPVTINPSANASPQLSSSPAYSLPAENNIAVVSSLPNETPIAVTSAPTANALVAAPPAASSVNQISVDLPVSVTANSPAAPTATTTASGNPAPAQTIPMPTSQLSPILTTAIKLQNNQAAFSTLSAPLSENIPATSTIEIRPSALVSATPQAPQSTPLQPGDTLIATVIGKEVTGEALLQTPVGVVRLAPDAVVPTGSSITFEVVQSTPPANADNPIAGTTAATIPAPLTELAQQWTALQSIYGLLTGQSIPTMDLLPINLSAPNAPTADMSQSAVTPQAISAGLMVFMSALRGSDFRNWLGVNNVKWLEDNGHADLIKKAEGEFMGMARQLTQTQPQHWQPLFFPIAVHGQVQQMRLFIKRDRKQGDSQQSKAKEDTRFVIEVDLSQLGELQLDGFVRHQEKDVQFDMMIRSLTPLPQEIQNDIAGIYNDMGAITGYKGSIAFQHMKDFPVNPMEDIVAAMNTMLA